MIICVIASSAVQAQSPQARSAHLNGTAGYLSEWAFEGHLTTTGPADSAAYTGSVTWKHVGLCSVNGPEEKSGEVTLQLTRSGPVRQIDAVLEFDGSQCSYRGAFSGGSAGRMNCSAAKGIPLTLSITADQIDN